MRLKYNIKASPVDTLVVGVVVEGTALVVTTDAVVTIIPVVVKLTLGVVVDIP